MERFTLKSRTTICLLLMAGMFSCKKETGTSADVLNSSDFSKNKAKTNALGDWINFNTSSNKEYTIALAEGNFGNMVNNVGWDLSNPRAEIINHELRVKMLANTVSSGGLIGDFDIPDGPEYEVTYDVKFPTGFDFGAEGKGGKLGFGLAIGDGNTGATGKSDGNGGSVRMMWNKINGKGVFKPYIYHTDMADNYGDDLDLPYGYSPGGTGLATNTFYTIKIRVKSNTGADHNGELKIKVNGNTIVNRSNLNYAKYDGKRWIRELLFHTFRGGNDSSWYSASDSYIYYDNIRVVKDPTTAF